MNNLGAVVLAGGKGTRIGQKLPKALYPLAGKPMIHYIIETLQRIPLANINVVVGYRASDVKANLDDSINIVYQNKQLGTGHALKLALYELHPSIENVLVVNCDDSAFYEATTLRSFIQSHTQSRAPISLVTYLAEDPTGLGRIIRDDHGDILKIVEENDASDIQKKVKEVNTGCYLVNATWAKEHIDAIKLSDKGEYYLTDLIEIAIETKMNIGSYQLESAGEWMTVNTQGELHAAHSAMIKKLQRMHTQTVTFVDLDNTIIDSSRLKNEIPKRMSDQLRTSINLQTDADEFERIFTQIYQSNKQSMEYVDIPEITEKLADHFELESAEPFRSILMTLPFKKFILPGAKELLEFLSRWSRVVLFADGDLVYQPVKVNSLSLSNYYHDLYISEKKSDIIPDLMQIYNSQKKLVIDDQILNLEKISASEKKSISILVKQGEYQDQKPLQDDFEPTFTASNLYEVIDILRNKVFVWA